MEGLEWFVIYTSGYIQHLLWPNDIWSVPLSHRTFQILVQYRPMHAVVLDSSPLFQICVDIPIVHIFLNHWGIDHLDHNLFFVQFRSQQFYLFSKHRIKVNTRWSVENLAPWWTLFWYLFIFLDHRGAIQIAGCTYWSSSNLLLSCRTHKTTTKGYLCFRSIWRCSVWTEQPRNRSQISGSCYCSCLWCSCCSSWGGSFAY